MDKRFWGIIAAIAVIFVAIIWVNGRNDSQETGNSTAAATSHTKGAADSKVKLVEYGDFQCPVCALYEPTIKQVVEKYQDTVTFQFRHFPLQQIHQNAFAGSRAAEAAGLQGKFWEMHDKLYENQNAWSASANPLSLFEEYAKTIDGLDAAKFKTDFSSSQVNDAVNADIREGNKLKISGTPAFYLNGRQIELRDLTDESSNQPTLAKFSQLIDAEIKKTGATAPAETTTDSIPADTPADTTPQQ